MIRREGGVIQRYIVMKQQWYKRKVRHKRKRKEQEPRTTKEKDRESGVGREKTSREREGRD